MFDDTEVVLYKHYYPPGVKRVIASGSSAFIGEIDESTVLKYPLAPGGDMGRLDIEMQLLKIVGPHKWIIGLKNFSENGLYLERALNGTLAQYLLESGTASLSIQQQITWCREAAEAVAWVHAQGVIHCDIQPTNFLVDKNLHLKLSDFQGKQISQDGGVLLDGGSSEPCRFYCPRADPFEADIKTDLFALGCTIYFIMMRHAVFPQIIDGEDGWYERVQDMFARHQFPQDTHACSSITLKCWRKEYESAQELIEDLENIEQSI